MSRGFRFDELLDALPTAHARLLEWVAQAASARGMRLHLVGGPVRDLLLGRGLRDLDLLVEEEVLPLAEAVVRAHPKTALEIEAHPRFGTLSLRAPEASIDLARTRRETYAHPGALPEVAPGTLEEDVRRRDFGVNALVLPLDAADRSRVHAVVDLVDGLEDLAEGRLRVLHGRSFHDDPTRALRGARLAVRLGMKLERRSRTALRDALRDGAFGAVSGERWRREIALVFEEPKLGVDAGRILQLLSELHVLAALEPGLALPRDRQAPLRRLSHSLANPEWPVGRFRPWQAGLSIWLAPLATVTRRRTLERLAIRGDQATRILRFASEGERTLRALAKARGRGAIDALLGELNEESLQAIFALADVAIRRRIVRWGAEDKRRRAPVVGSDLVALGIQGPDVGRGLARIRAAFLDGEIANREEALVLAQELARRSARAPKRRGREARSARPAAVAPDGAILDTGLKRRRKSRPVVLDAPPASDSRSERGSDPAPVSPPDPPTPSKKTPRTDPTR
ncbi:MAG: CCA tRNA nucleotidyltransferase [Deltaproteobacteria bacterium]|nr:CCA tRNA nucleotidyltransferase [Deltaproteobacteria bacterium]